MSLIEIERKFLVKNNRYQTEAHDQHHIRQGFLNSDPNRLVRIRIANQQAYLTVKGPSDDHLISRFEWEVTVPLNDAEQLFALCEPGIIKKTRYFVTAETHTFEVDVFKGDNLGLVIAEIELQSENENFARPSWLGDEVTRDTRYYNINLIQRPFNTW
ncbi:MAG: CYTH domain-containing protein [Gammaproteobacteria bacterium]|nr:CYTH domain-containing protein [Gammaproteobacteria bacterium]